MGRKFVSIEIQLKPVVEQLLREYAMGWKRVQQDKESVKPGYLFYTTSSQAFNFIIEMFIGIVEQN